MDESISRSEVLAFIEDMEKRVNGKDLITDTVMATTKCVKDFLTHMPSAQPEPDKNPLPEQPDSDRLGVKTVETCTDTISRQAAIDALDKHCDVVCQYSKKQREVMCGACTLGTAFDVIEGLPSAQPEQKKGEWIDCTEDGYVECPFCHSATNCDGNKDELHFCFSCGADMRGEEG